MKLPTPLHSARLTVRSSIKADLPFLTGMWFDAQNGRYLSDPTIEFVDARYLATLDTLETTATGFYCTVLDNTTQVPVGSACIFPTQEQPRFEIGYCIHKS